MSDNRHERAPVFWVVQGDPGQLACMTKEQAEKLARKLFPDEDPNVRYARVYFKTLEEMIPDDPDWR